MILIFLLMLIICTIGTVVGFDLKKPAGWFYVLCGFIMGLAMGLTRNDWPSGLGIGIISAVLVWYGGTMTFKGKQLFSNSVPKNNRESPKKK